MAVGPGAEFFFLRAQDHDLKKIVSHAAKNVQKTNKKLNKGISKAIKTGHISKVAKKVAVTEEKTMHVMKMRA